MFVVMKFSCSVVQLVFMSFAIGYKIVELYQCYILVDPGTASKVVLVLNLFLYLKS